MISPYKPIGVFDSGYGGLTLLKEFVKELPQHDFLYLGDNARTPYGTRSYQTVYEYTLQSVKQLFSMGCELVILACNTASAKALRTIQQKDLPRIAPNKRVLGVIRPTTELIGKYSKSQNVGILATPGTVNSQSYPIEIAKFYPEIKVYQEACPMWVSLVENNEYNSDGADFFIKQHITSLLTQNKNIDAVVLGCTHYPLLMNKIKKYLPKQITLLSQGEIVAQSLSDYLKRHAEMTARCSKQGILEFYTTDSPENFDLAALSFFGQKVHAKHITL